MRVINCVLIIFIGLFLSNCTIEKRTFNKGYFVQWRLSKTKLMPKKLDNFDISYSDLKDTIQPREIETTNIAISSNKTSNNISHHFDLDIKSFDLVVPIKKNNNFQNNSLKVFSRADVNIVKRQSINIRAKDEKTRDKNKYLKFSLLAFSSSLIFMGLFFLSFVMVAIILNKYYFFFLFLFYFSLVVMIISFFLFLVFISMYFAKRKAISKK